MSTSTRRSFFKRRKGGRSSSRDSKELASYSDVASFYSDSETGPMMVSIEGDCGVFMYLVIYIHIVLLFYENDKTDIRDNYFIKLYF